jgi:hypothetical protein
MKKEKRTICTKPQEETIGKIIAICVHVAMIILCYRYASKWGVSHTPLLCLHTFTLPDLI